MKPKKHVGRPLGGGGAPTNPRVTGGGGPAATGQSRPADRAMRVGEMAEVGGIAMRWLEHGEGPVVVLIHGIPTSPALWRQVMLRIDAARCLVWQMVGYGASIPEGRERDISVARC